MTIRCPACNEILEIPEGLAEGQHLRCAVCNVKFSLSSGGPILLTEHVEDRSASDPQDEVSTDKEKWQGFSNICFRQIDVRFCRGLSWRRWTARIIDTLVWRICFLLLFYVAVRLGLRFSSAEAAQEVMFVCVYLGYFFFDAAMYALMGTTVGKSVMNLSVCDVGQRPISPVRYLVRNFKILLEGYWIVLPMFGFWVQHRRVCSGEKASYDQGTDYGVISTVAQTGKFDWKGIMFFIILGAIYKFLENYLFG